MINWRDCMVPAADMRTHVWIAYQQTRPYLPIAIADTAEELARAVGTTRTNVASYVSKHKSGILTTDNPRFACVYTGAL